LIKVFGAGPKLAAGNKHLWDSVSSYGCFLYLYELYNYEFLSRKVTRTDEYE